MVRTTAVDKNGLKKGAWNQEEDDKLRAYIRAYGHGNWRELPKWSTIATNLPGRTDNEIKNHWHTHLKRRGKQSQASNVQAKEQSSETPESLISPCKKLEAADVANNTPSLPIILESFPLSKESSDHSSLSAGVSFVAEDSLTLMGIFEESGEDFWTQPFVGDNTYDQDDYTSSFALYYDYNLDFFDQVLQELPDN
ncbi:hypothetical protein GH714_013466 [Hevea brasiliensis]|uniref:Uncharacterized protein n=1 Tax=Hevea brasiliensis TaxID=3981 RepID=A0A6A6K4E4_HEVBR|nr:hypothetical protein GH714_013466 [Hevea brasiliensis]